MTALERFLDKVDVNPFGCWLWTATIDAVGYGKFYWAVTGEESKPQGAHRFAYQQFVAPLELDCVIDHLCGVRRCVNPNHLEQTTQWHNMAKVPTSFAGYNTAKTHCPLGHEYTEIYEPSSGRTKRECRICRNAKSLERYHRRENATV